ncbi:hypothetical protein [Terasakiella pusilla]|uniref:hypothetical protein n=1 Tax=Terasakiella pusilla TaxID=64973 RepID=UPI00068DC99F|nr:hypothetical protein [Terasakiella pusilla]
MKSHSKPIDVPVLLDEEHRLNILNFVDLKKSAPSIANALTLQKKLEQARLKSNFTDGEIIGTGEADFTKGNVVYEFEHLGRPFQLLDVPGIEGDENQYEKYVHEAVAKAHLVFYVNGTNKKPEKATAEKIKRYLRRDANVLAICNIRGKADAYEFPEDRESLDNQKGANEAKEQTSEVLTSILGEKYLMGTENVQGLLAFCSLAIGQNGVSTIHRSRTSDLIKAQNGFLHDFGSSKEMRDFSEIDRISDNIQRKLETYKEDIVESNKGKLLRLLSDNTDVLNSMLDQNRRLTDKIKEKCTNSANEINECLSQTLDSFKRKRKLSVDTFFTTIEEGICKIIENNFKENEEIERLSSVLMDSEEKKLTARLQEMKTEMLESLNERLSSILKRLNEDVHSLHLQQEIIQKKIVGLSLKDALMEMDMTFKEFASDIGTYALTGGTLGMAGGPVVAAIGTGIGALVGAAISWIKSAFFCKETKIRNAKKRIHTLLQEEKRKLQNRFNTETEHIITSIKADVQNGILKNISDDVRKMENAMLALEMPINRLNTISESIKGKEYGTI